jgi:GntR family transcriptional repressor for pyruvate dehydrogenase complex
MARTPDTIARPRRQSLPAQVAEILTEAVLAGRFPPGSTLPPERELAEQLGINRTSLRQALARLEQAGLVESRQGVGTVVRDPAISSDGGLALRALSLAGPDLVAEVLEVRESLGALAGRLAAERATPDALCELAARFDAAVAAGRAAGSAVATAGDGAALQGAELQFFSQLVAATRNRPLQVMMSWLERLYGEAAPVFRSAFADGQAVVEDLRRVLETVTSRQPDLAEAAVRDYARASGARFLAAALRAG